MATEIVGSLFGVTPEMFQQRQAEMADRQALEYAQLSPLQRASFNLARGGYQLAGALGGQDPQLQMISRRQAIARQIDPTNLNSMQMGIQALAQAGDQVGAMQLSQVLRQAENDIALRSQREASALASTAQAGKTQQEVDSLKRQQEAYRRFKAGETGEAPASAAATAAQEQTVAPSIPVSTVQSISAPVAAPVAAPVTIAAVQRSGPAKEIFDQYGEEAARFFEDKGYFAPSMFTPLAAQRRLDPESAARMAALEASAKKFREDEAESSARFRAAVGLPPRNSAPAAAPVTTAMVAPTAAAPVAQAAQPAAAAPVSQAPSDIAAQIKVLEDRRRQLNNLFPDVTAAKNEAEDLKEQIKVLRDQMKPADVGQDREAISLQEFDKRYSQLTTAERTIVNKKIADAKNQSLGADREAIAQEVYDKPFLQLTQVQRAVVNKRVEEEQNRRARSGAAVFPGDKALADIPAFRRAVQQTIDPQLKTIYAARQALQSINDSIATNNFVSFNAARTQLARSLGDSQLSRRDIEQAGGDPSILGGLIDVTSRAFTSTPSIDTQKKIRDTLQAIQTVARRQARGEVDQQRRIALRSPGYNAEAVNEALTFPELQEIGVPSVAGGDLAARAAAELARRAGANNGR